MATTSLIVVAMLAAAPATAALLAAAPPAVRLPVQGQRRPARMALEEPQRRRITLTGCASGVGVGLDADNRVDMLTPGLPAEKVLVMGDRVISWNDVALFDDEAGRRLLKDVVVPADSHVVVIERAYAPPPLLTKAELQSEQQEPEVPMPAVNPIIAKALSGIDFDDEKVEFGLIGLAVFVLAVSVATGVK